MIVTSTEELVLQLLIDKSIVDTDVVETARASVEEQVIGGNLDANTLKHLVEGNSVTEEQVAEVLADNFNMTVARLDDVRVSTKALEALPLELAKRYKAFPLEVDDNEIVLAVADPLNMDAIDNISHVINRSVIVQVATSTAIDKAIEENYDSDQKEDVDDIFSDLKLDDLSSIGILAKEKPEIGQEDAPIIRYAQMMIADALKRRASDIHMEPLEKRFRVRYRIDGVLHEVENPPKRLQAAIISRIKLMAEVSISEKRVPLDGRINIKVGSKVIDLRVSTLPTVFGESIVMRILDKEGLNLGLPQLGFFSDDQATFEKIIAMPDGVFLVTGPTGSGKSTTLYSALNSINQPDRKIITVEDPVEYELMGVNQVQVNRGVGMTFSAALRSMLRQAPNVVMVGEIRDMETAEISINAALTGHMVFSTLHTNDAPSAISRLVDIGVKPFLVAAALRAVLAQRLVRRICAKCAKPHAPDEKLLNSLGIRSGQTMDATFMKGEGCVNCSASGFRGRVGIFEIFCMNEEFQQMIYEDVSLVALRTKSKEMGMRTMREDGIRKVLAGVTTAQEVLNVTVADSN
ncbi:MAG: general secretion pathway protein E/type IV pilus assembly protein PilB [Zhongshania aliphaticivorans]